jgi:alpha-L-rhamnosidase
MSGPKVGTGAAIDLRVEHAPDAVGVDETQPRFSWRLPEGAQSAYQVEVSADDGTVWDSGRVPSARSHLVDYAGASLRPFTAYRWRARWWDESGRGAPWSAPAVFETGPLTPGDWAGAQWIGAGAAPRADAPDQRATPAPLLRRAFAVDAPPARARLYLCGLGHAVPYVNGRRLDGAVLDPPPTRYDKTVLFSAFDVTDLIRPGANVVGVELGRGKFGEPRESVWLWHTAPWWGDPRLIALVRIDHADGEQVIVSDPTWGWRSGPIRSDSLLGGERCDARLATPGWSEPPVADDWPPAVLVEPPRGRLRARAHQPIEVVEDIAAVSVASPGPAIRVFDFGRPLAGWARLTAAAAAGEPITLAYGEKLTADGSVDAAQTHVVPPLQTDVVISSGGEIAYEPMFSYKGFRYVQVDGAADHLDVLARLAHTAVESRSDFSCSSPVLNQIHQACRNSVLDNLHGIPTDTPMYEKNGWTGDAHLSLETSIINFDIERLHTKWLRDFADCQRPDGQVPPIIPAADWGYSDSPNRITAPIPMWDAAYFEIAWALRKYRGDSRPMAEHYGNLGRYVGYLRREFPDLIVTTGIGDWMPPGVVGRCPEGPAVYATAYFFRCVRLLTAIAAALGRASDARAHAALARSIWRAFNAEFAADDAYHGDPAAGYRQAPNAVALDLGLVPPGRRDAVLRRLVADIERRGRHLDTGAFGTKHLLPALTRAGHLDLAYDVVTAPDHPSYAHWMADGGATLWEAWDDDSRSLNHHYFSSVDRWFYETLLGVAPAAPGYQRIRIAPHMPEKVSWARGRIGTPYGDIEIAWQQDGRAWDLDVTAPPNTEARVLLPSGESVDIGPGRQSFDGRRASVDVEVDREER